MQCKSPILPYSKFIAFLIPVVLFWHASEAAGASYASADAFGSAFSSLAKAYIQELNLECDKPHYIDKPKILDAIAN